jgi:4-carboxymuconolactone decarboxylase
VGCDYPRSMDAARPAISRIRPVERVIDRMLEGADPGQPSGVVNLVGTLSHHRPLREAMAAMSGAFAGAGIDPRMGELVTLRTAWDSQCAYLWAHHAATAARVGITDADLVNLTGPVEDGAWSAMEAAALRMVDDLHRDNCVSDGVWAALSGMADDVQLVALVGQASFLRMASNLENSLGIQPEAGLPTLPVR